MSKSPKSKLPKSKSPKKNRKYQSNVLMLGLTSLFQDVSTEMITPILPLFLSNVLGASGLIIGLIEGMAHGSERIFSIFFGWLSDKMKKRKPLVLAGYIPSTIMKCVYAFTISWPQFFGARFIERGVKAVRTPARDALISESVGKLEKRASFAIHRILDTIGAVIGPLLTVVLFGTIFREGFDFEMAVRWIFLLSVIPGMVGVFIIAVFVKEVEWKRKADAAEISIRKLFSDLLNFSKYGKRYNHFIIALLIFYLAWPAQAFFYLKSSNVGFVVTDILLLATFFNIAYILGAVFIGFFSKKIIKKIDLYEKIGGYEKGGLMLGMLLMTVAFFVFSIMKGDIGFIILFGIYGLGAGIIEVEAKVYIPKIVKREMLGEAFGAYRTLTGISIIISGAIIGILWDISSFYAFIFAGAVALVSLMFFALLEKK